VCSNFALNIGMADHRQVLVKVNAEVDAGIAEVVSILNRVEGLQTIESCQGERGAGPAYVYFWYGDWKNISEFVFEDLSPRLSSDVGADHSVSVEIFNGSRPTGRLQFSPEATNKVASVLNHIVSNHRSSGCSGGSVRTMLRS
jgi:hypothetical protein